MAKLTENGVYVVRRYNLDTINVKTGHHYYTTTAGDEMILTKKEYEQLGKPNALNAVIRRVGSSRVGSS
jgi:hypothetical protein